MYQEANNAVLEVLCCIVAHAVFVELRQIYRKKFENKDHPKYNRGNSKIVKLFIPLPLSSKFLLNKNTSRNTTTEERNEREERKQLLESIFGYRPLHNPFILLETILTGVKYKTAKRMQCSTQRCMKI